MNGWWKIVALPLLIVAPRPIPGQVFVGPPLPDSITLSAARAGVSPPYDARRLEALLEQAERLGALSSLLVARRGEIVVEEYYGGMTAEQAVNVKSVSKTILSPLIGIATRDGLLEGPDQPLSELLPDYYERLEQNGLDAGKRDLTLHHLLSMTTGIQTTSFRNYGAWVASADWVWDALRRPVVCEPRCWEYSTGNTHMLSVILTRRSGKDLRTYARDVLFAELGIPLAGWDRDPQGNYLGGNNMSFRPRDLLVFGQLFLDGGRYEGRQLVPREWIELSWRPNATSPWNGHRYGYLWWSDRWGGRTAHFAWGYGGQYVVVVPSLDLVIVATSSLQRRQRGHTQRMRRFMDRYVVPAFDT
jgi:CubicO group peptidase (beta-lactamase class C family)